MFCYISFLGLFSIQMPRNDLGDLSYGNAKLRFCKVCPNAGTSTVCELRKGEEGYMLNEVIDCFLCNEEGSLTGFRMLLDNIEDKDKTDAFFLYGGSESYSKDALGEPLKSMLSSCFRSYVCLDHEKQGVSRGVLVLNAFNESSHALLSDLHRSFQDINHKKYCLIKHSGCVKEGDFNGSCSNEDASNLALQS